MSWLSELFRSKRADVQTETPCILCKKQVKIPSHIQNWEVSSFCSYAICDDCQIGIWEEKKVNALRKEQEYFDRIAETVAKKLRAYELVK